MNFPSILDRMKRISDDHSLLKIERRSPISSGHMKFLELEFIRLKERIYLRLMRKYRKTAGEASAITEKMLVREFQGRRIF